MSGPEHRDANSQGIRYTKGMDSRVEFREPLQTNIQLTRSQQEARQRVVEILEGGVAPRIVLVGLSGVGKNVVLKSLEPELTRTNAQILDPDQLRFEKPDPKRPAITTSKPNEIDHVVRRTNFNQSAQNIVVAGMDADEIKEFVGGLDNRGELSKEQIITYSMGIPGLAVQLGQAYTTEAIAESLVAQYLYNNLFDFSKWGTDVNPVELQDKTRGYLQAPLPWDLRETTERVIYENRSRDHSIYSRLGMVSERLNSARQSGIEVENPLFVAPESQAIYDEMMRSNTAWLDLFVPELTQEDLAYIESQMFNLSGPHRDIDSGPVAKAFYAGDFGKFGVYFKNLNGRNIGFSSESFGQHFDPEMALNVADQIVEKLLKSYSGGALKSGESKLEPSGKVNVGSLLVHKHGHSGYQAGSIVVNTGWMMESFLQQRDIAYVAANVTYGKNYLYDPKARHISILGTREGPSSRALDTLADTLVAASKETEDVGFPENVRQADFYTRLKEKFGEMNTEQGLQTDSLTLGDVHDIATLYDALINEGFIRDKLDPHMTQTVATAAQQALDAVPDESRNNFNAQMDLIARRHDINSMDRSDPIFELPVDIGKLIQDSFVGYYEISHYPGGIIIRSKHEDRNRYEVLLTQRNAIDKPVVYQVFQETGLPVVSN